MPFSLAPVELYAGLNAELYLIEQHNMQFLSSTPYYYKWKNHFYKMKGDVGMSGHEKERKQEDAYTKIQTHS